MGLLAKAGTQSADVSDDFGRPLLQKLTGIKLLASVFDELSKHAGEDFSTEQLLEAAQHLIKISKGEYIDRVSRARESRPYYFTLDLNTAYELHQAQILCFETPRMFHCDCSERSAEESEWFREINLSLNERDWEF
jgi:hypothetical protein